MQTAAIERITIGQLDQRLTLQSRSAGVDVLGQASGAWVTVATVWGRARPVRSRPRVQQRREFHQPIFRKDQQVGPLPCGTGHPTGDLVLPSGKAGRTVDGIGGGSNAHGQAAGAVAGMGAFRR